MFNVPHLQWSLQLERSLCKCCFLNVSPTSKTTLFLGEMMLEILSDRFTAMASSYFHGDSKNSQVGLSSSSPSDHQCLAALWDWLFGFVSMTTLYTTYKVYIFASCSVKRACFVSICIQHCLIYRLQKVIFRQHVDFKPIRSASFKSWELSALK